jgi:hypothetical protein
MARMENSGGSSPQTPTEGMPEQMQFIDWQTSKCDPSDFEDDVIATLDLGEHKPTGFKHQGELPLTESDLLQLIRDLQKLHREVAQ